MSTASQAWIALTATALSFVVGCAADGGKDPLPPEQIAKLQPVETASTHRLVETAPRVLGHNRFQGKSGAHAVTVQDLHVEPGAATELRFNGAALVEVRDGEGRATISGKVVPLAGGQYFVVAEGATVKLDVGKSPLVLQAYVVIVTR